jgi:uncharacterized protein involved in outer membrane biogenesis
LNSKDLGSLIGAPPRGAWRTPAQISQAARLAAESRFLPDARLDVDRVRAMDAVVRYRTDAVSAPNDLPLRQVRLTLILNHGVMSFDPLSLAMPHGEVTGRVRIDARGALAHDAVDLKVLNVRLEDLFPHAGGPRPSTACWERAPCCAATAIQSTKPCRRRTGPSASSCPKVGSEQPSPSFSASISRAG